MKFDVVVGNPPYQENDNGVRSNGSANASASPKYQLFFQLAKLISKEKINLIFPARWLSGSGKGLTKFTEEMLNDHHIRSLTLFENSKAVFSNNDIKGGVLYLTYDKNYDGPADITVVDKDSNEHRFSSYLNSGNSGVFIPYGELISIYRKVIKSEDFKSFQDIVSKRKPFGLPTDYFEKELNSSISNLKDVKENEKDIEVIGLLNSKRTIKYIDYSNENLFDKDLLNSWKVFIPYAYGKGEFGEPMPKLVVAPPRQICTETFLCIGPFSNREQAEAATKYMGTKFFRAMIGILKTTQHSTGTYHLIPLLDFTENSEINWKESYKNIESNIYLKYGLDSEEIDFIQNKIREVE